jgi:hypothetical protein
MAIVNGPAGVVLICSVVDYVILGGVGRLHHAAQSHVYAGTRTRRSGTIRSE